MKVERYCVADTFFVEACYQHIIAVRGYSLCKLVNDSTK